MPVTHVNTQFDAGTAVTLTIAITKPVGLAVGDVMVAYIATNQDGLTSPGGHWVNISQTDTANSFRFSVWYCIATSTETAASSFTWTNTAGTTPPMYGAISAYRGVDQNNPINTNGTNTGTTGTSVNTPTLTTTKRSWIVYAMAARLASTTIPTYSSSATERADQGNHGGATSYSSACYDNNAESAAGSVSAMAIVATSSPTNSVTVAIALQSADVSASAGSGAAPAAAYGATVQAGQSAQAGRAAATAAGKSPSALTGQLAFPGVAAATTQVPDVGRTARPTQAAATSAASQTMLFFGTPSFRLKQVPAENRTLAVGTNREAAG